MFKKVTSIFSLTAACSLLAAGIASGQYNVTVDATGATYPWIDATGGTNIGAGDDSLTAVTWPFDFTVYGDTYTGGVDTFDINSNGSVHFDIGGPRTLWVNCGDAPSTIDGQWVAVLGDDLDPTAGGAVYWDVSGTAPNQILTVEWADVPEFGGTVGVDLQLNFYEGSNLIVSQYREGDNGPLAFLGDGVGGINQGDGLVGQEVYCAADGTLPSTNFDVEYSLIPEPSSVALIGLGLAMLAVIRRRR